MGYSLLEVMVALGLLGVIALACVLTLSGSLRLTAQNREALQATQVAQQLLEKTQQGNTLPAGSSRFDGRQSTPSAPVAGFPPDPYPSVNIAGQNYLLEVVSEPVAGTPELYSVMVYVYWNPDHKIQLQTFVHRRG